MSNHQRLLSYALQFTAAGLIVGFSTWRGLYKLNAGETHSLKAPGFQPLNAPREKTGSKVCFRLQLVQHN
jgi:hypothetical protein